MNRSFWKKDGTRSVLASLLSILIGLLVGSIVALIVGLGNATIGAKGAWDGIRLIVMGLFATGRDAAGALTFGFNPVNIGNMLFRATPLILTGLSVAWPSRRASSTSARPVSIWRAPAPRCSSR